MALAGGKGEAVALGVSTVLNLDNFDGVDVSEYSRFILNSPRSLRACHRFGVKPVELLPRSIVDFAEVSEKRIAASDSPLVSARALFEHALTLAPHNPVAVSCQFKVYPDYTDEVVRGEWTRYEKSRQRLLAALREERAVYVAETTQAVGHVAADGSGPLSMLVQEAEGTAKLDNGSGDRYETRARYGYSAVAGPQLAAVLDDLASLSADNPPVCVHSPSGRGILNQSRLKVHEAQMSPPVKNRTGTWVVDDAGEAVVATAIAAKWEDRRHRRKVLALREASATLADTINRERGARTANLTILKRQSLRQISASGTGLRYFNTWAETSRGSANNSSRAADGLRRSLSPRQEHDLLDRSAVLSSKLEKELRADTQLQNRERHRDRTCRAALHTTELAQASAESFRSFCLAESVDQVARKRKESQNQHAERASLIERRRQQREDEAALELEIKEKRGALVKLRRQEAANIGQQVGKALTAFREARRSASRGRADFSRAAAKAGERARIETTVFEESSNSRWR